MAKPSNPFVLQGAKILMAEDDDLVARVFRAILERFGGQVVRVSGGRAAIQAAHDHHFDVALLDLGLPDMDGTEVARQVNDLPCIALTGNDSAQHRQACEDAGMVGYLVKPPHPEALVQEIARHLAVGAHGAEVI
ncbi:hypothetical protein BH11ARM2_BH11ARM2_20270 [soil metagenome]